MSRLKAYYKPLKSHHKLQLVVLTGTFWNNIAYMEYTISVALLVSETEVLSVNGQILDQ